MADRSNKNFFKNVQQKTNVSEKQLKSLASKVKPQDLQNEKSIRALIAQIASVAGVPVSKEKEDQIVNYLKKHSVDPGHLASMVQMFMKSGR